MHEIFNASIEPSSNDAVDCILIGTDNAQSSVSKLASVNSQHIYQQDGQRTYNNMACSSSVDISSATHQQPDNISFEESPFIAT
jgi:hypothetical protein